MARVVMVFEDLPGDKVKVTIEPTFETLMRMMVSGHELTSAQGYAISAANEVRRVSKSKERTNKILVPRIGRS